VGHPGANLDLFKHPLNLPVGAKVHKTLQLGGDAHLLLPGAR